MASVYSKKLALLALFVAAACTISVAAAAQDKSSDKPGDRSGDRAGDAKSTPQAAAAPDSITEG